MLLNFLNGLCYFNTKIKEVFNCLIEKKVK